MSNQIFLLPFSHSKNYRKNINPVTYLVGDGGGYEMPRWLGDNKFDWPDVPGTSRVLLLMVIWFKFKFGKLWPKCCNGWTFNVFVPLNLVGLFCGTFFKFIIPWLVIPSSLDSELALSKSMDTVFDSVSSTDPLKRECCRYNGIPIF